MSIAAASIFGEWDGQRWRFSSEPSPAPHLDEQIMDEGDLRGAPGLVVLFEAETSEPGLCKFGEAIVLDEIDIAFLRLYFPEHPLCQAPVGCRESEEREKQAGFSLRQTDPLDRHLLELLFVRNLRALIADIIGRTAPGQSS
ncbi:hypothetical protein [Methylocella tundrae]|uniref:Uncharacterized protein n=1 Tax=Methylocella tundrae TaxID=227605 RepID=A0A4U8YVR0_METTU|nr:hypothetical protein [Methylocella tundrae]WPP05479.1 hypothetical protein SIN04_06555 [Methylocella tundrae]VFU07900.1 protein of unknown function [Methylocella tundrae]